MDISRAEWLKDSITGWRFADCITLYKCPKCKAKQGMSCRTPKGRKTFVPHSEREKLLPKDHGKRN